MWYQTWKITTKSVDTHLARAQSKCKRACKETVRTIATNLQENGSWVLTHLRGRTVSSAAPLTSLRTVVLSPVDVTQRSPPVSYSIPSAPSSACNDEIIPIHLKASKMASSNACVCIGLHLCQLIGYSPCNAEHIGSSLPWGRVEPICRDPEHVLNLLLFSTIDKLVRGLVNKCVIITTKKNI